MRFATTRKTTSSTSIRSGVKRAVALALVVFVALISAPMAFAAEAEEMEEAMGSAIDRAEAYLDSIDVGEIKAQFESMGEFWQALLGGAPAIVMAVLAFVLLFMVLRKVLGR